MPINENDVNIVINVVKQETDGIQLTEEAVQRALQGVEGLKNLARANSSDEKLSNLDKFIENTVENSTSSSSSFSESFPNFSVFEETQKVLDHYNSSKIVESLVNSEGVIGFIKKFHQTPSETIANMPLVQKFLDKEILPNLGNNLGNNL